MADIELTLGGDASGAVGALNETGQATGDLAQSTGKAVVAWQLMAEVATKAASAVVKYGVDAVRAFAQAERIQAQLNRAAGEYGETLGKQAEAMSRLYTVDDDIIKQSQTLLVQWGGVGAATEKTTKAILDYAAATGTDAVGATQALIRNVESGGVGMAKLGIHFKETGKRGDDLAAAVGAINAKFGGAAVADASTLSGSARAAQLAVDDLQKSIGGMLGTMLDKSGAMGFMTTRIREITKGFEVAFAVGDRVRRLMGAILRGDVSVTDADLITSDIREAATAAMLGGGGPELPAGGASDELTNKGRKEAASAAGGAEARMRAEDERREAWRQGLKEDEEFADTQIQKEKDRFADELALEAQRVEDSIKIREAGQKAYDEIRVSEEKKSAEHAEKMAKNAADAEKKASKETADRTAKESQRWGDAGDQIGAAFVGALSDQLQKMSQGEEFDVAIFVGEIIASAVAIAGTVIGSAYGQPALGAALGNLAAMGVRAGAGAISSGNKKRSRTYHDGGWVGDEPRFHDGAWIGGDEQRAILQTGERVLSRNEVHHMGGPRGVDNMARKGGGPTIINHIQAIDSKNAAESFQSDLGQGMKRALRTGHGDVPRLLGVGPR